MLSVRIAANENVNSEVEVSERRHSSWKTVACYGGAALLTVGAVGGLAYTIYLLATAPEPSYPTLGLDEALNAVNGTVKFIFNPGTDCNVSPNMTANVVWAPSLNNSGFTLVGNIFGNSTEMVKERALAFVQQLTFPLSLVSWGLWSNGDGANNRVDYSAAVYTDMQPLSEDNPLFVSSCEKPVIAQTETTWLIDDDNSHAAKTADVRVSSSRLGFYTNKVRNDDALRAEKENTAGARVSDEGKSDNSFVSALTHRLRRHF